MTPCHDTASERGPQTPVEGFSQTEFFGHGKVFKILNEFKKILPCHDTMTISLNLSPEKSLNFKLISRGVAAMLGQPWPA